MYKLNEWKYPILYVDLSPATGFMDFVVFWCK